MGFDFCGTVVSLVNIWLAVSPTPGGSVVVGYTRHLKEWAFLAYVASRHYSFGNQQAISVTATNAYATLV